MFSLRLFFFFVSFSVSISVPFLLILHFIELPFCCFTVLLFHCFAVPLFCCPTVLLFHCFAVPLFCCSTVLLFHCFVVPLFCCSTVLLFHCSAITVRFSYDKYPSNKLSTRYIRLGECRYKKVCDINLRKWAGKCVRDRDMRRVRERQR